MCTYVLEEKINYYKKNSDVFVMILDASKAFDCVHHVKLFNILHRKGLCPLICHYYKLICILNSQQLYIDILSGVKTS